MKRSPLFSFISVNSSLIFVYLNPVDDSVNYNYEDFFIIFILKKYSLKM